MITVYDIETITRNIKKECEETVIRFQKYLDEDKENKFLEMVKSRIDTMRSQLGIYINECWESEAARIIEECQQNLSELWNQKYIYPYINKDDYNKM